MNHQIIKTNEDGRVNPNETITRGEWLNMMVKAVDPYYDRSYHDPNASTELFDDVKKDHPYYPAARWALERKWIDQEERKLKLDQPMTREDLALSLIHIVNYTKLAKFMDSEGKQRLRILPKSSQKERSPLLSDLVDARELGGKFNPEKQVTRAEGATVIMRLVELQGKTDVPIGQMVFR